MSFGLRELVHPEISDSVVDVEGSRERRAQVREQVRRRAHLLACSPVGDAGTWVPADEAVGVESGGPEP